MKLNRTLVLGVLAAAGLACTGMGPARGPDNKALAKSLVGQCAGIKEGEIVMIGGGTKDQELLENIAAEVSAAGAFPLLTFESDRLTRMTYEMTPQKYDGRTSALGLKLAQMVQAEIMVDFSENPKLMADVPPARRAVMDKAEQEIYQTMLSRGVRMVSLGNGLYPTQARAEELGVTKEKLSEIFWAGVNTDYAALQSTGEKVKSALASGNEVQVTNPNGTDVKFKIQKRPVFVSDGVISADDVKRGGSAVAAWLPAGEVYVAPAPGTAEGTVVIDRMWMQGRLVEGLSLTFKAGKMTAMTAKSGLDPLKAEYDAGDEGKDAFGFIDLGINPDVHVPEGGKFAAYMPAGMVTIGVGNNLWAGGDDKSVFNITGHIPGSTVKVDGKAIVEKGNLKP